LGAEAPFDSGAVHWHVSGTLQPLQGPADACGAGSFSLELSMNYAEIAAGLPVIASLILIEGLLSVDNVLGIAALASELPEAQQKKAIRLGMVGAYGFRVLALLAVSWISNNTWARWFAAGYLVYLMSSHLTHLAEEASDKAEQAAPKLKPSYAVALTQIALMDLSLSIDNVIAAVALAPVGPDGNKMMWPIYVGVLLAILALLTITPYAVKLLEQVPVLEPTAFVLIGFVGFLLIGEEITHQHVPSGLKFACLVGILVVAVVYARVAAVRYALKPFFLLALFGMKGVSMIGGGIAHVVVGIPKQLIFREAAAAPGPDGPA
jgi:YkoY family integral membrane protein